MRFILLPVLCYFQFVCYFIMCMHDLFCQLFTVTVALNYVVTGCSVHLLNILTDNNYIYATESNCEYLDSHALQYKCTCTARERRARRKHVMHELEQARARTRAEVYPVYDHYQMYMYHRCTQRMAQIVHMGNTLHNREYLSWCTD